MKSKTLLLGFITAQMLIGCVMQPPSTEGVLLFKNSDYQAAAEELSPLAARGDAKSKYYMALLALGEKAQTSLSFQDAKRYMLEAARGGAFEAYAHILFLYADESARQAWVKAYESRAATRALSTTSRLTSPEVLAFIESDALLMMEELAGGPVQISVLDKMHAAHLEMTTWPTENTSITIDDADLLKADQTRAKLGDKFAQARLGNRYAIGRGVETDLSKAFRQRLKAAKTSPAPQTCIYQAPVGDGAGSTYCYRSGEPTPGVPQAILEVCRSYANGIGVQANPRRAKIWCKRAARTFRYNDQAREILETLPQEG